MNDVLQRIYEIGIVPVIALDDAEKAVPLAKALVKGGLPAAFFSLPGYPKSWEPASAFWRTARARNVWSIKA